VAGRRIYLDNAATSWPKPASVEDAIRDYQQRVGAAAGRGMSAESEEASQIVEQARVSIARLIGSRCARRIIFTQNGTDSLNLAIHGLLKAGDHVVTSVVEHNSVLRPLRWLQTHKQISVTHVPCDRAGVIQVDEVRRALQPRTRLIALTHASNVTGAIQPIEDIAAVARQRGVLFLLDAAQTIGHWPLDVEQLGLDLLAAPGHKGLLGPLGTGLLYLREGIERFLAPIRQGGTGTASGSDEQPEELPDKYESGNLNVLGLAGLGAGVRFCEEQGIMKLREQCHEQVGRVLPLLESVPGVRIVGPREPEQQVGVVSFAVEGHDSIEVGRRLAAEGNVQGRAGYHCAARLHPFLETTSSRGTVRFSFGPFTSSADLDEAVEALTRITRSRVMITVPAESDCAGQPARSTPLAEMRPADGENRLHRTATSAFDVSSLPGLKHLWSETRGDPRILVAVIDGPVDLRHPCFSRANLEIHPAFRSVAPNGGGATAHGTHVASILFGQHDGPVQGIVPKCTGLVLPVFKDAEDGGVIPCSQIELARAISLAHEYAVRNRFAALVINISGGQPSASGSAHPLLAEAISRLSVDRHLLVAAAGNGGCDCLQVPGSVPMVLSVGAMDGQGEPLAFSNWGEAYRTGGLLAPGQSILGAAPQGTTESRSGTSYATPIVSGVAALLMSRQLLHCRSPSAVQVRRALLRTARGCAAQPVNDCRKLLAGRLNVVDALNTLTNEGCPVMTTELLNDDVLSAVEPQDQSQTGSRSGGRLERSMEAGADPALPRAPEAQGDVGVQPAGCGCRAGGSALAAQKVYAIGRLGFDFGTRQRREYFRSQIGNPDDPAALIARLTERGGGDYAILNGPQFASRMEVQDLTWTLMIDETPVYALAPVGAFAFEVHDTLVRFLAEQLPPPKSDASSGSQPEQGEPARKRRKETSSAGLVGEGVERMAVGGQIVGQTRLYTGESVPIVAIDHRTLANWNKQALVEALEKISGAAVDDRVSAFLDRLSELTRNLGVTSQDRALNYAATDALILQSMIADDANRTKFKDMEIDDVIVRPSPICRPDYDCWEVVFTFYDPDNLMRARRGLRYTVDVSDTLPQIVSASERAFTLR
jgi:cysteine desulfurase family protein